MPTNNMQLNTFLSLKVTSGTIEGESQQGDFAKQIECLGWSWNISQQGSAGTGLGGSTGVATVSDFTVVAPIDKSFPLLLQCAHQGTAVEQAVLTVCKLTGDPKKPVQPYQTFTISGGILSSINASGTMTDGNTSVQTMTLTFNFATIKVDHAPQSQSGDFQPTVSGVVSVSGVS